MAADVSVVLPTYNEEGHIAELVRAVCALVQPCAGSLEIVVVDDASPDGTAMRARSIEGCPVKVVERESERGLASAVRRGIECSRGEVLIVMDADFNHRVEDTPRLLAELDQADVAVGSRFVRGGGMPGSRMRYWGSWLLNTWIALRTESGLHDHTSGFLALGRGVLEDLDFDTVFRGYGDYCIRLLCALRRGGARITEVPVRYGQRKSGESKTRLLPFLMPYLRTTEQIRGSPH